MQNENIDINLVRFLEHLLDVNSVEFPGTEPLCGMPEHTRKSIQVFGRGIESRFRRPIFLLASTKLARTPCWKKDAKVAARKPTEGQRKVKGQKLST